MSEEYPDLYVHAKGLFESDRPEVPVPRVALRWEAVLPASSDYYSGHLFVWDSTLPHRNLAIKAKRTEEMIPRQVAYIDYRPIEDADVYASSEFKRRKERISNLVARDGTGLKKHNDMERTYSRRFNSSRPYNDRVSEDGTYTNLTCHDDPLYRLLIGFDPLTGRSVTWDAQQ
jgi:hypothetical protein